MANAHADKALAQVKLLHAGTLEAAGLIEDIHAGKAIDATLANRVADAMTNRAISAATALRAAARVSRERAGKVKA